MTNELEKGMRGSGDNLSGDQGSGEVKGGFFASIIDIFADPMKVFKRIDGGLQWWKAYILISLVSMVIGWFNQPVQSQLVILNRCGMSAQQLQTTLERMQQFGFIGLLVVPIAILLIYVILAGIVNMTINLTSGKSDFKKCLALISFTGFIGLLEQILKIVIIYLKGIDNIESAADIRVSLSLAALFPEVEGFWYALMESLSVFQIWFFILFVFGVAAVFKVDKKKALVPAIVLWIVGVVVGYIGTLFGGRMG